MSRGVIRVGLPAQDLPTLRTLRRTVRPAEDGRQPVLFAEADLKDPFRRQVGLSRYVGNESQR